MLLHLKHMPAMAVLLIAVVICLTPAASAQVSADQFLEFLVDKAGLEPAEISLLENGGTVVKLLNSKDKKQVAVCGIVRLNNAPEISMTAFRDSLTQKDNESKLGSGEFSTPPVLADLRSLKLRSEDIDDLKKCEIGNCNLKMSATMIKRMRTEVDWNEPDHPQKAAQLYEQMLIDYAGNYLANGDRALMQYDSRKTRVRLGEDYRKMLHESLFVNEIAPEFVQYLRDFPASDLPGVENRLDWSTVTFGLDPILTFTHTASYSHRSNDISQHVIATKQIYSSRYLDSTLAFTLLVTIPAENGVEKYLIFTDISRAGVLDGIFSDIKRSMVEKEAAQKVREVLDRAAVRLRESAIGPTHSSPTETGPSTVRSFAQSPVVRGVLVLLLAAIVILIFREWRLYSKRFAKK